MGHFLGLRRSTSDRVGQAERIELPGALGNGPATKYPNAARDPACFDPEIGVEF